MWEPVEYHHKALLIGKIKSSKTNRYYQAKNGVVRAEHSIYSKRNPMKSVRCTRWEMKVNINLKSVFVDELLILRSPASRNPSLRGDTETFTDNEPE